MKGSVRRAGKKAQPFSLPANQTGFSLVEVIFTIAITVLIFAALFGTAQLAIKLVGLSRSTSGALSLAKDRMEYIRSLPYRQVGTVGAPPYGDIPQTSTTTLNGVTYTERVLITYVDDPADGEGAGDTNLIMEDYKKVKVIYSWDHRGEIKSVELLSNIIPVGEESTTGGGTIRVTVFDDTVTPVSGAEVHFVNYTLPTTTDTVRYTNDDGMVPLGGAPAGANYEISATKAGYSTDSTYVASTTNPSPSVPPVTVVEALISSVDFQIAPTSDLTIRTIASPTTAAFTDDFTTTTLLATTSSTSVATGNLELIDNGVGGYVPNGSASSQVVTPGSLESWYEVSFSGTTTPDTSYKIFIYYDTGSGIALVPDTDLPTNSSGFTQSPIDISNLATSTYQDLYLVADLSTTDTNQTPQLFDWSMSYITNTTPEPGIAFRLSGNKSIGTDALSQPVLKYEEDHTTDGSGEVELLGMEWDTYDLELLTAGYGVAEACPGLPYSLQAGTTDTLELTLVPATAFALRVAVTAVDGTSIHGADVNLTRGALDVTEQSSVCGQVYFNTGLVSATDYTLTVSKPGYTTYSDTTVAVTGSDETITVILN